MRTCVYCYKCHAYSTSNTITMLVPSPVLKSGVRTSVGLTFLSDQACLSRHCGFMFMECTCIHSGDTHTQVYMYVYIYQSVERVYSIDAVLGRISHLPITPLPLIIYCFITQKPNLGVNSYPFYK